MERREKQYNRMTQLKHILESCAEFFPLSCKQFESQRTMNKQKQTEESQCLCKCTVAMLKQFDKIHSDGFWSFQMNNSRARIVSIRLRKVTTEKKFNGINLSYLVENSNIFSTELLFAGFARSILFKCNEIDVIPGDNANQLSLSHSVRCTANISIIRMQCCICNFVCSLSQVLGSKVISS